MIVCQCLFGTSEHLFAIMVVCTCTHTHTLHTHTHSHYTHTHAHTTHTHYTHTHYTHTHTHTTHTHTHTHYTHTHTHTHTHTTHTHTHYTHTCESSKDRSSGSPSLYHAAVRRMLTSGKNRLYTCVVPREQCAGLGMCACVQEQAVHLCCSS